MPRVLVTGMGVVSPVGSGCHAFREALRHGQCGIGSLQDRDPERYHSLQAALVDPLPDIDGAPRWMDRATRLALPAFDEAVRQSGLQQSGNEDLDAALVVGTTLGGMYSGLAYYESWTRHQCSRSHLLRDFPPYAASDHLMARGALQGMSIVLSSACAASAHAIGTGYELIRSGLCTVAIVGGVDTFTELTHAGFGVLGLLSPDVVLPFSAHRQGLVLGEGAAFLVLESEATANQRKARPLGEILGFGMTSDAYHMTSPEADGRGAAAAMRQAIAGAGIAPGDIGYVNAHGTATRKNDETEIIAMTGVFGSDGLPRLPLSSTKSMIGHTLGAAGALEAVATLLALNEGFLPPTINTRQADVEFDIDTVPLARETTARLAMSNSFGFGGNNASLVLRASAR